MKSPNLDSDADKLTAFVDGELDLPSQLAVEAQAGEDEGLRARLDELGRMRRAVREGASYHAAPAALRERLAGLAPSAAADAPTFTTVTARRIPDATTPGVLAWLTGWLSWPRTAAALAGVLVLGVALNVAWLQVLDADRIADEVVTSHVRATLGQRLVDVASSDHHTVKPWLSGHLDFSPPVVDLALPGSSFLGGRVDYVDGRPVAALVYRQGQHVVTSFLWPASGGATEPRYARERGFETAHWVERDMHHWVVSDLNPTEFRTLVAEIRRQEAAR